MMLPEQEKPKETVFGGLFRKLKDTKQAVQNQFTLKKLLTDSIADGVLTSEENAAIRNFMEGANLSGTDLERYAKDVYAKAFDSLNANSVSEDRLNELEKIQHFLGLSDSAIETYSTRLQRFETIARIRSGKLPEIAVRDVILRKDEKAYWVQPSRLWEERVVSRGYQGGSRGVSIRVVKGVSFRVGASRGKFVSDTADVPVSDGNLIVTNERFIFVGESKSFETKYQSILDINNHIDGLRYSEKGRQKRRSIQYLTPNGDIIVEILSKVLAAN